MKLPSEHSFHINSCTRWDVCFFLFTFIYIYTHLFNLPFTPIYFEGDHLIPVTNALRMFQGEQIFTDFFHFIPPGAELIYYFLFSIFDVKIWILSFVILLIWLAMTYLVWYMSKHIFSGAASYLPALIYLVVGFRLFGIDGSYRLFSVTLVLGAIALIFKKRTNKLLMVAGAMCGAASFFVQTRGLVMIAGIGLFLIWEGFRNKHAVKDMAISLLSILVPFFLVVLTLNAYFLWASGIEVYWFSMVDFIRFHYVHDPLAKSSSYLSDFPNRELFFAVHDSYMGLFRYFRNVYPLVFYYAIVPLIYFVYLAARRIWPRLTEDDVIDPKLMLLSITGLFLAVGTSAPTAMRLYQVAVPAVIIFVYLLLLLKPLRKLAIPLVAIFSILAVSYSVQRQIVTKHFLELPGGKTAFFDKETADKYQWVAERTKPGDLIYEAHHPTFYFPLHLKNPTPLYLVRDSEYTPDFQVNQVVEALKKTDPRIFIWEGKWSKPDNERSHGDNLAPLWNFLNENYSKKAEFIIHGEFTLQSSQQIEMWEINE